MDTKSVTTAGIQRARRLASDDCEGLGVTERSVVGTVRRQRIEVVDHREDPRPERNLLALEAVRIPLAVPTLVVRQYERRHRVREGDGADDLRANLRVDLHLQELLLGEGTRLREDVFGNRELADVVQQGSHAHALHFVR